MKKIIRQFILAGSILSTLTACDPKNQTSHSSPNAEQQKRTEQQGGIDSSGGDLVKSSTEQFETAINKSLDNVRVVYWRLSEILSKQLTNCKECNSSSIPVIDERYGGIAWINADSNEQSTQIKNVLSLENKKQVQEAITKIKIKVQDTPCTSNEGHRDASASSSGEICLNSTAIKNLAPESLELNLTALLAHEVGHVLGFDEFQAATIQKYLKSFPALALKNSTGATKIRAAYDNRSSQLFNISQILRTMYLNPKIDQTNELCKYDLMTLFSPIQSDHNSNEYIPFLDDQVKMTSIVTQIPFNSSSKIIDYCNTLTTNDKPQIKEAKNALMKDIKNVTLSILQMKKQIDSLSDEVRKALYPTSPKHITSPYEEFSQYQTELLLNGTKLGKRNLTSVKCTLNLESETHVFELFQDSKKTFPIKNKPELEAYIQISGRTSYENEIGTKDFLIDVQVFSPKIKTGWWLDVKSDKTAISYFDHTYSFLTSGVKESLKYSGDFMYQKDSYNLDTVAKNIELSCVAN